MSPHLKGIEASNSVSERFMLLKKDGLNDFE